MTQQTDSSIQQGLIDYGFYLIQRGEAGHKRGCYTCEYGDSGGVRTIGYGTVTEPGYNDVNYREKNVTEEKAVQLAKDEMVGKVRLCQTKFKDFDQMLPCFQAVLVDTAYQGYWVYIQNAVNEGNWEKTYEILTDLSNPKYRNYERTAVRGRAVEMGMLIMAEVQNNPQADPEEISQKLAEGMIKKYAHLNGTDQELTLDELALLYRSCMAGYGIQVSDEQIERFALNYMSRVAVGTQGIGSNSSCNYYIGPSPCGRYFYDGSSQSARFSNGSAYGYSTISRRNRALNGGYDSVMNQTGIFNQKDIKPIDITFKDNLLKNIQYIPAKCRGKAGSMNPCGIIIHSTGSRAGANATANYFSTMPDGRKASANFVIGKDGKIIMCIPPNTPAYHAGIGTTKGHFKNSDFNHNFIGIEVCYGDCESPTAAQLASLALLQKSLMKEYPSITSDNMWTHDDITPGSRRADPVNFPIQTWVKNGLLANAKHDQTITNGCNPERDICLSASPYYRQLIDSTSQDKINGHIDSRIKLVEPFTADTPEDLEEAKKDTALEKKIRGSHSDIRDQQPKEEPDEQEQKMRSQGASEEEIKKYQEEKEKKELEEAFRRHEAIIESAKIPLSNSNNFSSVHTDAKEEAASVVQTTTVQSTAPTLETNPIKEKKAKGKNTKGTKHKNSEKGASQKLKENSGKNEEENNTSDKSNTKENGTPSSDSQNPNVTSTLSRLSLKKDVSNDTAPVKERGGSEIS